MIVKVCVVALMFFTGPWMMIWSGWTELLRRSTLVAVMVDPSLLMNPRIRTPSVAVIVAPLARPAGLVPEVRITVLFRTFAEPAFSAFASILILSLILILLA